MDLFCVKVVKQYFMKKYQKGLSNIKADKNVKDSLSKGISSENMNKFIICSRRFIRNRLRLENYRLILKNSAML